MPPRRPRDGALRKSRPAPETAGLAPDALPAGDDDRHDDGHHHDG
jgi:hypothetical protein